MNSPSLAGQQSVLTRPLAGFVPTPAQALRRLSLACCNTAVMVGRCLVALPPSTWLLVDVALLACGIALGFHFYPPPVLEDTPHVVLWQAMAVFAFAGIVSSLVFGLYERETVHSRSRILIRLLLTIATTSLIAYTVIYAIMYSTVSRRIAFLSLIAFLVSAAAIRLAAWWAIRRIHRGLLIVGSRNLFESFVKAQEEGFLHEYQLIGYVSAGQRDGAPDDPHYLGPIAGQLGALRSRRVTELVVGDSAARDQQAMTWLSQCLQQGCRVTNEATFYETATGQILVHEITPDWFLFADLKVHCDQRATLKRLLDLITASLGLLVTAPLWPLIALAIKVCDGGPVFYSQLRVGQGGRHFRLRKFRTMRIDAENGRSIWASPNDPRVTIVGRLLRRSRLDELPQLVNVLLGEMSVVGPRPERPDIVTDLETAVPYYAQRHLVKPGITGWAQISFRYGASVEDARRKLQFDLYYLKHMSFELDTIILFRTFGTFLRGAC